MQVKTTTTPEHAQEVKAGERFEFGKNWARFLEVLDDERIARAEASLRKMLEVEDLKGKRFLDIGSGSGLFSLAARRLGARVHSFDYDPHSVACGQELKRRYFPNDPHWIVEEGSALDEAYIAGLGSFDIVYSWGVLHHTGQMWRGLANAALPVADGGKLFVAIYNDQGTASGRWLKLKRIYNRTPRGLRFLIEWPVLVHSWWRVILRDALGGSPMKSWRSYGSHRGMSPMRDVVDWVGGYPFEVAKPEQILRFYREKGFTLVNLATAGGSMGCNEFIFVKRSTE